MTKKDFATYMKKSTQASGVSLRLKDKNAMRMITRMLK